MIAEITGRSRFGRMQNLARAYRSFPGTRAEAHTCRHGSPGICAMALTIWDGGPVGVLNPRVNPTFAGVRGPYLLAHDFGAKKGQRDAEIDRVEILKAWSALRRLNPGNSVAAAR